ncbi:sugar transferase [Neotabrizicola sp. sgz301269]|uniref:sugar transferase n=1 Tax=Neotabrizicola sp. sgz301269 TaxID=3276282 RepID=UPI00376F8BBB
MAYESSSPATLVGFPSKLAKAQAPVRPNRYFGLRKRVFDLLLVAMMIPVALPVVALMWLLVRLDGGPGFYSQPRIGRDGRTFRCWKLRSMAVNAEERLRELCEADPKIAREWAENQKLANDPRITRIGQFLRKSSLDELPQLWNILVGDMSIVGPRPFLPEQQDLYTRAGGRAYFLMRPGVTGEWQVYGRSATRFVDRIRFDEGYYDNASLGQDVRLLMGTARVVVRMTGR